MPLSELPTSPLRHLVFFDKPAGITSHDAVQIVKRIYRVRKAGHTGTLDPAVTGLLVVALEEACKVMPLLVGLDKDYVGTMHLHDACEESALLDAFVTFTATLTQTPPVRSRVKREPRQRTVHALELLGRDGRSVRFRVRCEAGTYIRTLCVDMGEHLGVGAHMTKLRRTAVGPWTEMADRDTLHASPPDYLVPVETVLTGLGLKRVELNDEGRIKTVQGKYLEESDIERADVPAPEEKIGFYHHGRLIAIGRLRDDGFKADRVLN